MRHQIQLILDKRRSGMPKRKTVGNIENLDSIYEENRELHAENNRVRVQRDELKDANADLAVHRDELLLQVRELSEQIRDLSKIVHQNEDLQQQLLEREHLCDDLAQEIVALRDDLKKKDDMSQTVSELLEIYAAAFKRDQAHPDLPLFAFLIATEPFSQKCSDLAERFESK